MCDIQKQFVLPAVHDIGIEKNVQEFFRKGIIENKFHKQQDADDFPIGPYPVGHIFILVSQREKAAEKYGKQRKQIHKSDQHFLGDGKDHERFPGGSWELEIIFKNVIVTDIFGQIQDHKKDGQGIKKRPYSPDISQKYAYPAEQSGIT